MGTRSSISIELKSGKVKSIYCNYDGYLSHVGLTLQTKYKTIGKIKKLISLGELSSLGSHIEPDKTQEHSFHKRQNDVCFFYKRDRGEKVSESVFDDINDFLQNYYPQEYNYIFKESDKIWYLIDNKNNLISLHSLLLKEIPEYEKQFIIEEKKKINKSIKKNNKVINKKIEIIKV